MNDAATPAPPPQVEPRLPHTRESLIAVLQALAAKNGGCATRETFDRETRIGERHYLRHFGSWSAFLEAAGIVPYAVNKRISDDALLGALREEWLKAGGPVPRPILERTAPYRLQVYKRRWGPWPAVLGVFREWLKRCHPDFPYLEALDEQQRQERAQKPRRQRRNTARPCGGVINFRGCLHAPTCESGVVLLFGMVAEELGFLVETVSTAFPDCEAKRLLPDGRWERLRVEFEMESRNFVAHAHDAEACDLIVCWEHNWQGCPLEVLELKTEVERLRGNGLTAPRTCSGPRPSPG